MWELFQQILKEGMTPNQFLILYGIKRSLSLRLPDTDNAIIYLASQGFIKLDKKINTKINLTIKGEKVVSKFENYFIKAKKRTSIQLMGKKFNLKLNEYREIFPAGKLPSGKPARVNIKSLENSFRWFFENYDFSWNEVISATKMYVNEYRDKEYMYMKTSQYFICKSDKNKVKISELADYCDMIRDGVKTDNNDHFKEKVV